MAGKFSEWHWEITTRCNLTCRHCIGCCSSNTPDGLSADQAIKAVRIMRDLGCEKLLITGGEPLVYPALLTVLNECRRQKIGVQILTNGFLIENSLAEQLSSFVEAMSVSLDGSTQEIHDFLRGAHSFKKACRAIKLLSAYMPVTAFITASRINIDDLENTIKLAFSLGASRVHTSEVNLEGRAGENHHLFSLPGDKKRWLIQLAKRLTADEETLTTCEAPELCALFVNSQGLVYPCSEIAFHNPRNFLGDTLEKGFRKAITKAKVILSNNPANCRYQIYSGNNLVFTLNQNQQCFLSRRNNHD